tara:strand:- start:1118 stop:2050 length:933 start_codon:yes stop_codon:yes gene_type:complete
MKIVSITGSLKNEEKNIKIIYDKVVNLFSTKLINYDFEIIFIDNASSDKSVKVIKEICKKDKRVKLIENLKDYGQDKSPYYALLNSSGDYVVPIVTDLQDPIEFIEDLVKKIEIDDIDMVLAIPRHTKKGYSFFKKIYYKIMDKISDIDHVENYHGFGIYKKSIINVLRKENDNNPYFRSIFTKINFTRSSLEYDSAERVNNVSKNNIFSLLDIGIKGVSLSSDKIFRIIIGAGMIGATISFLIGCYYFYIKITNWYNLQLGLAPLIIGFFFLASVLLVLIGFSFTHLANKIDRNSSMPLVVEKDRTNFD